jgi:peptidoglycan/xylan/chitin deacetylase (PgdA/CDA1 family)
MSHSKFIQPSTTDLPSDVGRSWLRATKTGEPRLIALTFDDGPIPGATEDILNALKVQGWSATFCVLGQQVEEHPGLLRRMVAQGHEVTGHGWSHANLMDIEPDAVRREVLDCLEIIEKVAGLRPRWFRPPFLASNPALRTRIRDEFLCAILDANVDPQDYQHPAPGVLTETS